MKAIETAYKGYRFRSRMEARWAVFFDSLGIEWQYEPEGFELPDGSRYLPDFYMPDFDGGLYVEVKKPGGDLRKPLAMGKAGYPVLIADGPPDFRVYFVARAFDGEVNNACFVSRYVTTECRLYVHPECADVNGIVPSQFCGPAVIQAVKAARGARFEFGESGAIL